MDARNLFPRGEVIIHDYLELEHAALEEFLANIGFVNSGPANIARQNLQDNYSERILAWGVACAFLAKGRYGNARATVNEMALSNLFSSYRFRLSDTGKNLPGSIIAQKRAVTGLEIMKSKLKSVISEIESSTVSISIGVTSPRNEMLSKEDLYSQLVARRIITPCTPGAFAQRLRRAKVKPVHKGKQGRSNKDFYDYENARNGIEKYTRRKN